MRPGSSVGRATDFKHRKEQCTGASRGKTRNRDEWMPQFAGTPLEFAHHNVAGNGERDGRRRVELGNQQARDRWIAGPRPQRLDAARLRWRRDSPDSQHHPEIRFARRIDLGTLVVGENR